MTIFSGGIDESLENLCDFWEYRHDPNVGFFFFDDLKEDHAGGVKRIAEKMGIEATPELVQKVADQSTPSFMSSKEHHIRFDGLPRIAALRRAFGIDYSNFPPISGQPPRGDCFSVKVSKSGGQSSSASKKKNSDDGRDMVEACFKKIWERIVLPRTGFASLELMRAHWKTELSQKTA